MDYYKARNTVQGFEEALNELMVLRREVNDLKQSVISQEARLLEYETVHVKLKWALEEGMNSEGLKKLMEG